MATLILFDFDETLYEKDSLLEFTKFYKGKILFNIGMIVLSPILIAMKLGLISNEKAKQKFISYFFKNEKYDDFKASAKKFSLSEINLNLNTALNIEFCKHLDNQQEICIVTASLPEWIEPWANKQNTTVIGTKINVINNIITGKLETKNCNGIEKVNRITAIFSLDKYEKVIVYGKGKGDLEMHKLAK